MQRQAAVQERWNCAAFLSGTGRMEMANHPHSWNFSITAKKYLLL